MRFVFDERMGEVRMSVTTREGGVSSGPYASLNLGDRVGDDATAVEVNLARVGDALGVQRPEIRLLDQVHGATVIRASGPVKPGEPLPSGDAMIVDFREIRDRGHGLALGVRAADCAPVLLVDAAHGVMAVAHCGRRGLVRGIIPATVDAMRRAGAAEITAVVGPAICGGCYPLPVALADEVAAIVPAARSTTSAGTPSVDIGAGALAALRACGVEARQVGGCTVTSPDVYSHRRDGVTGRFAAFVSVAP